MPERDLYLEAWQTLVELRQQGRVRSIGVSNFDPTHIDRIIAATRVTPPVNQIELHPRFQQRDMRSNHERKNIRLQSWSPLGPGNGGAQWWTQHGHGSGTSLLTAPDVAAIAQAHGKTPAQIVIAWHL